MRSITATFLAWIMVVSAQQAPRPAAQAQPPVVKGTYKFEATATLVVETVSLKDKRGTPVEALPANAFLVVEDGKPQTVKFCEFQKLQDAVAPQQELKPRT